jgi:hypothetical protein
MLRIALPALLFLSLASFLHADEKLKGVACRSVHLGYPSGEGTAFYNEITVSQSAPGTYFMVCGWDKGYFGIQEQGGGKKLLIFSVWDSGSNDPKSQPEEKRVKMLGKDEKTRIGRFGGEGSGGQSFYDYDWKVGETYRFLMTSKIDGDRTEYAGYFFVPEEKKWKHLVTFSTITGGKNLKGLYSFVEDFKRDKVSATKAREATFGNTWYQNTKGDWLPLDKARFTGDANPVMNIDSGMKDERFFLITGGETENKGTKLKEVMTLPANDKRKAPGDLPVK